MKIEVNRTMTVTLVLSEAEAQTLYRALNSVERHEDGGRIFDELYGALSRAGLDPAVWKNQ